jgi:hypothetical protein
VKRPHELDAEAYELDARAAKLRAEAARLRASSEPANDATPTTWMPVAESPLGKRKTLALARAGVIESSKVGRAVLVRRLSLMAYLEEHQRGADDVEDEDEDEDLFGARRAS